MLTILENIRRMNRRYNRKRGSALIMVMMTMAVIFVVGTSMVNVTLSTFSTSLSETGQEKAYNTSMAVAETLKNNVHDLVKNNMDALAADGRYAEGNELTIRFKDPRNESDLLDYMLVDGAKVRVTLHVNAVAGATIDSKKPSSIRVDVRSTYRSRDNIISFMVEGTTAQRQDQLHTFSQSFQTGNGLGGPEKSNTLVLKRVDGNIGIDCRFDRKDKEDPQIVTRYLNATTVQGITGSVVANGNLVVGSEDNVVRIRGNLYVDGSLVIRGLDLGCDLPAIWRKDFHKKFAHYRTVGSKSIGALELLGTENTVTDKNGGDAVVGDAMYGKVNNKWVPLQVYYEISHRTLMDKGITRFYTKEFDGSGNVARGYWVDLTKDEFGNTNYNPHEYLYGAIMYKDESCTELFDMYPKGGNIYCSGDIIIDRWNTGVMEYDKSAILQEVGTYPVYTINEAGNPVLMLNKSRIRGDVFCYGRMIVAPANLFSSDISSKKNDTANINGRQFVDGYVKNKLRDSDGINVAARRKAWNWTNFKKLLIEERDKTAEQDPVYVAEYRRYKIGTDTFAKKVDGYQDPDAFRNTYISAYNNKKTPHKDWVVNRLKNYIPDSCYDLDSMKRGYSGLRPIETPDGFLLDNVEYKEAKGNFNYDYSVDNLNEWTDDAANWNTCTNAANLKNGDHIYIPFVLQNGETGKCLLKMAADGSGTTIYATMLGWNYDRDLDPCRPMAFGDVDGNGAYVSGGDIYINNYAGAPADYRRKTDRSIVAWRSSGYSVFKYTAEIPEGKENYLVKVPGGNVILNAGDNPGDYSKTTVYDSISGRTDAHGYPERRPSPDVDTDYGKYGLSTYFDALTVKLAELKAHNVYAVGSVDVIKSDVEGVYVPAALKANVLSVKDTKVSSAFKDIGFEDVVNLAYPVAAGESPATREARITGGLILAEASALPEITKDEANRRIGLRDFEWTVSLTDPASLRPGDKISLRFSLSGQNHNVARFEMEFLSYENGTLKANNGCWFYDYSGLGFKEATRDSVSSYSESSLNSWTDLTDTWTGITNAGSLKKGEWVYLRFNNGKSGKCWFRMAENGSGTNITVKMLGWSYDDEEYKEAIRYATTYTTDELNSWIGKDGGDGHWGGVYNSNSLKNGDHVCVSFKISDSSPYNGKTGKYWLQLKEDGSPDGGIQGGNINWSLDIDNAPYQGTALNYDTYFRIVDKSGDSVRIVLRLHKHGEHVKGYVDPDCRLQENGEFSENHGDNGATSILVKFRGNQFDLTDKVFIYHGNIYDIGLTKSGIADSVRLDFNSNKQYNTMTVVLTSDDIKSMAVNGLKHIKLVSDSRPGEEESLFAFLDTSVGSLYTANSEQGNPKSSFGTIKPFESDRHMITVPEVTVPGDDPPDRWYGMYLSKTDKNYNHPVMKISSETRKHDATVEEVFTEILDPEFAEVQSFTVDELTAEELYSRMALATGDEAANPEYAKYRSRDGSAITVYNDFRIVSDPDNNKEKDNVSRRNHDGSNPLKNIQRTLTLSYNAHRNPDNKRENSVSKKFADDSGDPDFLFNYSFTNTPVENSKTTYNGEVAKEAERASVKKYDRGDLNKWKGGDDTWEDITNAGELKAGQLVWIRTRTNGGDDNLTSRQHPAKIFCRMLEDGNAEAGTIKVHMVDWDYIKGGSFEWGWWITGGNDLNNVTTHNCRTWAFIMNKATPQCDSWWLLRETDDEDTSVRVMKFFNTDHPDTFLTCEDKFEIDPYDDAAYANYALPVRTQIEYVIDDNVFLDFGNNKGYNTAAAGNCGVVFGAAYHNVIGDLKGATRMKITLKTGDVRDKNKDLYVYINAPDASSPVTVPNPVTGGKTDESYAGLIMKKVTWQIDGINNAYIILVGDTSMDASLYTPEIVNSLGDEGNLSDEKVGTHFISDRYPIFEYSFDAGGKNLDQFKLEANPVIDPETGKQKFGKCGTLYIVGTGSNELKIGRGGFVNGVVMMPNGSYVNRATGLSKWLPSLGTSSSAPATIIADNISIEGSNVGNLTFENYAAGRPEYDINENNNGVVQMETGATDIRWEFGGYC